MAESGVWRGIGAFSRELKTLRARGEIFLSSSPPARDGMSLQHHVSAGRESGASPFPSISHQMHQKPSYSDPIPRALPEALLAPRSASLPYLPGTLLRKAHCLSCTSSRLETYLLSCCLTPLHRCSITVSASPPLLCSSQLGLSGLVSVQ